MSSHKGLSLSLIFIYAYNNWKYVTGWAPSAEVNGCTIKLTVHSVGHRLFARAKCKWAGVELAENEPFVPFLSELSSSKYIATIPLQLSPVYVGTHN